MVLLTSPHAAFYTCCPESVEWTSSIPDYYETWGVRVRYQSTSVPKLSSSILAVLLVSVHYIASTLTVPKKQCRATYILCQYIVQCDTELWHIIEHKWTPNVVVERLKLSMSRNLTRHADAAKHW